MGFQTTDRRAALQVARSLQSQLFFYEVEWGGRVLQDGVEDVYMFLDDNPTNEGTNDNYRGDREELPTGVITLLTKCYSPSCQEGVPCYSYTCPRRTSVCLHSFSPYFIYWLEYRQRLSRFSWVPGLLPLNRRPRYDNIDTISVDFHIFFRHLGVILSIKSYSGPFLKQKSVDRLSSQKSFWRNNNMSKTWT